MSSLVIKLPNFLLTPILTKIFNPKEYAPFINFYSVAGIISILLTHGMETSILRFANLNYDKKKVIGNAFLSILLIGIIFLIFSLLFSKELSIAFKTPDQIIFFIWFVWILFFDSLSAVLFAKLRLEEKIKKFVLIKIINSILYFILVLFFVVFLQEKIPSFYRNDWGVGYTFLANLMISISIFFSLFSELFSLNFNLNISLYRKMIAYSLPITIAGLAGIINETIDRQFLKYLLPINTSEFQIGIYGACYKFATIITLFKTAYLLGIEPFIFSQMQKQNSKKKYAILMKFFIIAMSVILLFILSNLSWIKFLFIPNSNYYSGISIVPIILIGTIFFAIYSNLSIWYKVNSHTYYGVYISIFGASITIIINWLFIPVFGFFASAIATLLSYFSMMLISYFLGQKKYPIPYNTRKLILYLSISILLGLFNFYILNQNVWTGNFCFFILLFFIYKTELPFMKRIFLKKLS